MIAQTIRTEPTAAPMPIPAFAAVERELESLELADAEAEGRMETGPELGSNGMVDEDLEGFDDEKEDADFVGFDFGAEKVFRVAEDVELDGRIVETTTVVGTSEISADEKRAAGAAATNVSGLGLLQSTRPLS